MLNNRRQLAHFSQCLKRPEHLVFDKAADFDEMRSLKNPDGSRMRVYCRGTKEDAPYLTSLYCMGQGLMKEAVRLGVADGPRWEKFDQGDRINATSRVVFPSSRSA